MKNKLNILTILSLSFLAIFIFAKCGDNKKNKTSSQNNNKRSELKQVQYSFENPPQFRKDGELHFVGQDSKNDIFVIEVEIASTDNERATGLMFRPKMDENKGMLFLMDFEERQSFYMRNTIISLDIIYINAKFEIVDIYKNTNVLDETSLPSAAPAKYVVEINAGLCDKYDIKIGDSIHF